MNGVRGIFAARAVPLLRHIKLCLTVLVLLTSHLLLANITMNRAVGSISTHIISCTLMKIRKKILVTIAAVFA